MGKYTDWALEIKANIKAVSKILTYEQALDHINFFLPWNSKETYEATDIEAGILADRVRFNGEVYECIKSHEADINLKPIDSPEYWLKIER